MGAQTLQRSVIPEIQFLLCCATSVSNGSGGEFISDAVESSFDWPLLFRLANENGLLPLVCKQLLQSPVVIPEEFAVQFRDANRQNAIRALFLTAELLRITEAFRRKGIAALSHKGPVLGQLAYADPLLRQFDDLDLVMPHRFMADVYAEMDTLGYEPKFSREQFLADKKQIPGEYVFLNKVNHAMVEVHTEFTLRHFPRPPDLDAMISHSAPISINGTKVPTFSLPDTLLMLCVHGAKDFWERLIWVADVAAVAGMLSSSDWLRVFAEAEKRNAERMVNLGLSLACLIFEVGLPGNVVQRIKDDSGTAGIATQLRAHLLRQRGLPSGVAWRSAYRVRMVPGIWRGIGYWVRLSTAPAEEDWFLTRERRSRSTYAVLRPVRLLRKYSRSPKSREQ
jgi:Uncharacterised nucleotidyltransferase